jgi:AmmeMemoRadiSam system protein A
MGRSRSGEWTLTEADQTLLLDLAESAIRASFGQVEGTIGDAGELPETLRRPGGGFVTLHVAGELNGCIGTIGGTEPIGIAVARLAVQAAFDDPRLPPLRFADLGRLHIEISLLSEPSSVAADTRVALLDQLRPGDDGLIIEAEGRRAVFLPAVWEQLPEPDQFLDHLLRKAGLATDRWPPDMRAEVFTTTSVSRHVR